MASRARHRAVAVLDAEHLRRLAEHRRPAVDAVLAAASRCSRWLERAPGFRGERCRDLRVSVPRRARRHPVFPRPRLARRRRAGRGARPSRSAARRARGCSTPAQVISLAYLPLALWLLSRALDALVVGCGALAGHRCRPDRARARSGRAARALCAGRLGASRTGCGAGPLGARARKRQAADRRRHPAALIVALPVLLTELLAASSNRPEFDLRQAGRGSLHPAHLLSLAFADLFGAMDPKVDFWGAGGFAWNERFGPASSSRRTWACFMPARCRLSPC